MGWFSNGRCTSQARLDSKTVVITGCNTGIGKYTVLDLYTRGAKVVMACRNMEKARAARDWIVHQREGQEGVGSLVVCQLDLSSLASVRRCARQILDQEQHIHILINNAGVMMCPRTLTEDGHELQLATNHLGPFLFTLLLLPRLITSAPARIVYGVMMCPRTLTEDGHELQLATNHLGPFLFTLLLLPRLITSAPARIVNVASLAHILCISLNFDDINLEKRYIPQLAYARSKMCNILFSRELADRLKGTGVTVYSLHPGVVNTELFRHMDYAFLPGVQWLFQNIGGLFWKSPEEGAQTTLYCAVDEATANETGLYYDDCQVAEPNRMARDDALAKQLWDVSLDLVDFTPPHPFGKSTTVS